MANGTVHGRDLALHRGHPRVLPVIRTPGNPDLPGLPAR
ncbi:hypothetical protein SLNWT_1401 [Streptomyces albus]|uniref:Uncharacterized protein n=1 Tax=Streptomyces albus (strain ATCC 21838 / DSM 41398 / FERM P-419 / JCM 4703 / NBRC 107858) TaxID=1081613 RepID=A0A0B5EUJ9_STRA4|nr:hypothetical protein SLNWT_1401 [Streptomyces albus]